MVSIILSYFLGILCLYGFSELPSIPIILSMNAFVLILAYCLRFKPWTRCLLAFSLGFLAVLLSARSIVVSWIPQAMVSKPIEVIGMVDSLPLQKGKSLQFQFKIQKVLLDPRFREDDGKAPGDDGFVIPAKAGIQDDERAHGGDSPWPNPGLVKLRWWDPPVGVDVGQQWRLMVKLKRPHGYANPGSFDSEKHFFEHHLVAEGVVVASKHFEKLKDDAFDYPIDRIRSWVRRRMMQALEGRPFRGVMMALSMGDQSAIPHAQWAIFRNTGTGHLLAISGLHISLIAGSFYFLSRKLLEYAPGTRFSGALKIGGALIGFVFACLYAALSGFSIPAKRALFMIAALMLTLILRRMNSSTRAYWIALGLVLVCDPLASLSPSFYLSFGAVGLILYSMQYRSNIEGWWLQSGRIHLILFLGLSPITLALFNSCSLVSPFANFIAIPYFSFIVVPLCLAGTLALCLSKTVAEALWSMGDSALQGLWPFLKYLGHHPYASWSAFHQSSWAIVCAMLGLLCVLLPKGMPGRCLGLIALVGLVFSGRPAIQEGTAAITVLDVGQGLATVVETRNHVLVFDTGPKLSEHFDMGAQVVLPFLASRQRKVIDCLIISHADNDHRGGADSILKTLPVHHILSSDPGLSDLFSRSVDLCVAGQAWQWDGVIFRVLHPSLDYAGKKNDRSCVLQVQAGTQSVLMTGDIEAKSEADLIEKISQGLRSTVLIVPHHGSKTSSTEAFISAVHPQYAIITAGYANRYGHPKAAIVERYREASIPVFDSIHHGALSFFLNTEETLKINAYRIMHKKYWNPAID